jgi:hypothetical protein
MRFAASAAKMWDTVRNNQKRDASPEGGTGPSPDECRDGRSPELVLAPSRGAARR